MSIAKMKNDYDAALDYLYSFVDYSLTRQLRYSAEKFNLNRMRVLMDKLANPQSSYPVIHVAGTKGKGSTSALIASVLQVAGYKVGLYTSPHLHDFAERIQINRIPISHDNICEQVDFLKAILQDVPEITTFEITTALAFRYFSQQKIDVAVVEVGLGGRLDATNVVDPIISVITSLSYDHMNILGDTIEKIAAEKAGIIKENRPVVVAPQIYEQTYNVVEKIAAEKHATLIRVDQTYAYFALQHSLKTQEFEIQSKSQTGKSEKFSIPLLGFHQVENAVTAYCVLNQLKNCGFTLDNDDIKKGFLETYWPCRFEVINDSPLVIVDSAHNVDSAKKLNRTVSEYLQNRKITLIFGVSEDKNVVGMLEWLLPISDDIIMTQSVHPRALEPEKLKQLAQGIGREVHVSETLENALALAYEISRENVILATGSMFVAAAAKEIIQNKVQDKR